MSKRSVTYTVSDAVKAVLTDDMVLDIVKATVNKAYDRNLTIGRGFFTNRFNFFTVNGKPAASAELIAALQENPETVGQVLPIVCLTEERGEDTAYVILQSEIEGVEDKDHPAFQELKRFVDMPPRITVEQLRQQHSR